MSARTEAVGPLGEDVAVVYRLWCRLGLALLCTAQAYGGRAEAIHEEAPGLPQLQKAAQALGVQLHEAHEAVLWLLGEGQRRGESELARLVGVMAALLTGLPALFKQVCPVPRSFPGISHLALPVQSPPFRSPQPLKDTWRLSQGCRRHCLQLVLDAGARCQKIREIGKGDGLNR